MKQKMRKFIQLMSNMKNIRFFILILLVFFIFPSLYAISEDDIHINPAIPSFNFKIRKEDLDFYDLMRGGLDVNLDISILQDYNPVSIQDMDFDMFKYQFAPYVVYPNRNDWSFYGYQFDADITYPDNGFLPPEFYYIDNYDFNIDFLDGLGDDVSIDMAYYAEGFSQDYFRPSHVYRDKNGDLVLEFLYDITGLEGNAVDQLDIIIVSDNITTKRFKGPKIYPSIRVGKLLKAPRFTGLFVNNKRYVRTPNITSAFITPHAPASLRGYPGYIPVRPRIRSSIRALTYSYYLLNEVYYREGEYKKHGDNFDYSLELSPYVFNIWAVKNNTIIADYALGFTTSARWKFIDERVFRLSLGIRSGYMYSFTSPVMFNLPLFAELGIGLYPFDLYIGIGGVYSGAYDTGFAPALDAGVVINIPVNKQDKLMIGVNANIARTYDTSDIKYLKLYSANVNPFIGYKHSLSYFDKEKIEVRNYGYVAIDKPEENEAFALLNKSSTINTYLVDEEKIIDEGFEIDDIPHIINPSDVNKALKDLDFKIRVENIRPKKIKSLKNSIKIENHD